MLSYIFGRRTRDSWESWSYYQLKLNLWWPFGFDFYHRTKIEDEYFKMKADMEFEFNKMSTEMEKEYFKMILDLEKKVSSTLKFEFYKMRSYINEKFSKMCSDMKFEFNKMSTEMEKEYFKMILDIEKKFSKMRSNIKNEFSKMRSYIKREISRIITVIIFDAGDSDDDTNGREMTSEKQRVKIACLLIGTLVFASTVCPCAGETEIESGQRKNQDHSQIYQSSLKYVSRCPNSSEYMYKTLEKCADVCGNNIQDGNCAYHCMRESSKTRLVECCAKPKIFFEYCPEFDPVHQTIQKDLTTLCNSNFSRNVYNSSDIYFCDPKRCLQLYGPSDISGTTGLITLMNGTTEMNSGCRDIQQVRSFRIWFLTLMLVAVVIAVAFVSVCILCKFGIFSARPRNKNNPEDVEKRMKKPLMVKM